MMEACNTTQRSSAPSPETIRETACDWAARKTFDQLWAIIFTALAAFNPCDRRVAIERLVPLRKWAFEELLGDPSEMLWSGWKHATAEQRREFLESIDREDAA